ncbi:hypothetical protein RvY_13333 [Ramazzottius varieornatus]|uniref:YMGG-like Gly-zipper domain-containing protein n=1 Tax=Ramazzottius varieornatus TaxID=947166 RepID=A0A1D1VRJ7_RAMVA|nr:hypothetical protein RvY_13333 [Ramazzottius varieornatus]
MNTFQICMAFLATFVISASCFPVDSELREKRQASQTITGGLGGAALGALIGHFGQKFNPNFDAKKGAAAGALIGGGAGFLAGRNSKNKAVTDSSISTSDDGSATTKKGFFSGIMG